MLRNNFRVTKKFLINKFDCKRNTQGPLERVNRCSENSGFSMKSIFKIRFLGKIWLQQYFPLIDKREKSNKRNEIIYGFSFIGYNHEALQKVLTDPKNVAALINRTAMGKDFISQVFLVRQLIL